MRRDFKNNGYILDDKRTMVDSIHIFDSEFGKTNSTGTLFDFKQPFPDIHSYRVLSVTIFTVAAVSPYYYFTCTLPSSEFSSTRNGVPSPCIAYLPNTSGGNVLSSGLYAPRFPEIPLNGLPLRDITIAIRDINFNVVNNIRFIIVLQFKLSS